MNTPGNHLPMPFFDYLDNYFIDQICLDAAHEVRTGDYIFSLHQCKCNGNDYYGMPDLEFALSTNGYDTSRYYDMTASSYELYPKINWKTKQQYCNLGLWNL